MVRPLVVLIGDRRIDGVELFERLQAREGVLALGFARDVHEARELTCSDGLDVVVAAHSVEEPTAPTPAQDSGSKRNGAEPPDFTLTAAALLDAFSRDEDAEAAEGQTAHGSPSSAALSRELAIRRSLRTAQLSARRLESGQAVAARLAEACTHEEVADALLEGALALGARRAVLFSMAEDDLVLTQALGYSEAAVLRLERIRHEPEHQHLLETLQTARGLWSNNDHGVTLFRSAIPLRAGGEPRAVLALDFEDGAFQAELERRSVEQIAAVAARALERAERFLALQQLLDEQRLLLGIASHDLRTPLQVVVSANDLLARQSELTDGGRTLLSHTREAARRALQLVAQLLELSRIELSDRAGNVEQDLFELVGAAVNELRVRAPDCEVKVALSGSGRSTTDARRVQQILQNLLTNAAHYREPGTPIEIRGEGLEERVYLEVSNRGPAIDEQQLAELFAPMKRGTRSGERGSLGLGLYIVERLAHEIGARVWARSSEEAGTTFFLELARHPTEPKPSLSRGGATNQRRSAPPPSSGEYDVLLRELEGTPHQRLLSLWLSLRGSEGLPDPRQLDVGSVLAALPDSFRVAVQPPQEGKEIGFCYEYVGAALERRLRGKSLSGSKVQTRQDALQIGVHAAYARCVQTRRPQYDYLRTGPSKPRRECFRRLVVPLSSDGKNVTHLLGLATFTGFDDATGHEREPALITKYEPQEPRAEKREGDE